MNHKSDANNFRGARRWRRAVLVTAVLGIVFAGRAPGLFSAENTPASGAFHSIDLGPFYTYTISLPATERPWRIVPRGAQTLGGVPFVIGGKLEVTGMEAARHGDFFPPRVSDIPVMRKAARLHLLHGAAHGHKEGVPMAKLVLHYANGETRALRLAYGVHARNWMRYENERESRPEDPNSIIAWASKGEESEAAFRFYRTTFDNPLPEQEIVSLEVVSLFGKATPVIFAMTLEQSGGTPAAGVASKRKAVARALEFEDAVYVRELSVRATEADGRTPLTNATANLTVVDDESSVFFGEKKADAQGRMVFPFPPQQTLAVRIQVRAPGRAPETVLASAREAEGLAREFHAALRPGTPVGGVVRSEAGQPVAGAQVSIERVAKSGPAEYTRTAYDAVLTDTEGRWSSSVLPAGFEGFSFRLNHPEHRPVTYWQDAPGLSNSFLVARSNLLSATAAMRMQAQVRVLGTVTDARGVAVTNADIFFRDVGGDRRRFSSDRQGQFSFVVSETGQGSIAFLANGFAPQYLPLAVVPGLKPLPITLARGVPLKVRALDQDGAPVEGASVTLDHWNNTRLINWRATTDKEGRFTWTNAPLGAVKFSLERNNYFSARATVGVPTNGEVTVLMRKSFRAAGAVVDAATKEPLPLFEVIKGHRDAPELPMRWDRGNAERQRRGSYSLGLNEYAGGETRLLIEATGYRPAVTPPLRTAGQHTNHIQLQKGPPIAGVVLLPNGTPAAKANVVLADATDDLRMDSIGALRKAYAGGAFTTADADGRFELAPRLEARTIFAAHPQGYAELGADQLATAGRIILQPWGSIRGTLRVGDKAPSTQFVALHNLDHDSGRGDGPAMNIYFRARLDAKGNFVFAKVPPGEWKVSLQSRPQESAAAPTAYSHGVPIVVKPGETNELVVGGTGRTVTGKIQVVNGTPAEVDWLRDVHTLTLQVPGTPAAPTPDFSKAKSFLERQKLARQFRDRQRAFWSTEKGRALDRAQRSYVLQFDTNGTFRADHIPPGAYTLNVTLSNPGADATNHPTLGSVTQKVVVRDDKPGPALDLGTIRLPLLPLLRLGQPAPAFAAKTFAGQPVKLESFRGNFLLLDFWNCWQDTRPSDLDTLRGLLEVEGVKGRLAILGVNLDHEARTGEAFAKANDLGWPQCYAGAWADSKIAAAYGLDAPIGCVLLDPEGKLASKVLRGEAIRTAVSKLLLPPVPTPAPPLAPAR